MKQRSRQGGLDLIWGGRAIGEEVGLTERQAVRLLELGALPGVKIGGKWCARRDELHALFSRASRAA